MTRNKRKPVEFGPWEYVIPDRRHRSTAIGEDHPPLALRILVFHCPEEDRLRHAIRKWKEWLATVGYAPRNLPQGFWIRGDHEMHQCCVVSTHVNPLNKSSDDEVHRRHPLLNGNTPYRGANKPDDDFRKYVPKTASERAEVAAHRHLARPIQSFFVHIPGRWTPRTPNWLPEVSFRILARGLHHARRLARHEWRRRCLVEMADARALGDFVHSDPPEDTWEELPRLTSTSQLTHDPLRNGVYRLPDDVSPRVAILRAVAESNRLPLDPSIAPPEHPPAIAVAVPDHKKPCFHPQHPQQPLP